jgi:hypothetical protein
MTVESAREVMTTVCWDNEGVLLLDVMQQGTTMNAGTYYATMTRLRTVVKRKCPGLIRKDVLLLHGNGRLYSGMGTLQLCSVSGGRNRSIL